VAVAQPPIDVHTLLEAGGQLGEEADRALLSLLCVHRLSEARIASLSGVGADRLRARRERVAALLAAAMGRAGEDVGDALAVLAAGAQVPSRPEAASDRGRRAPAARRRRRVLGGAIAGLCIALGIVAFTAERAHARPSPLTRATAVRALTATRQRRAVPPRGAAPRPASAPPVRTLNGNSGLPGRAGSGL
jgi:hypothetical protein